MACGGLGGLRGGGRERMLGVSMGMMKVKRTGGIGDSPDAERSSSFCGTWLRRCPRPEGEKVAINCRLL